MNDNINIIQVIGIHKLFEHSKKLNCGTFIGEIFQEDLNYKNIIKVEDGKKNEGLNREKEKIKFSEAPKKLLNNEKPNLIENIDMNKKDISRVLSLYYNEIEIRKLIDSQDNIVNIEEYYLISMDWIEEFKKVFHYDDILASYASQMKDSLKIKNLPKIYISKEDTKRLKILRNTNIFERYDLSIFFYQSFCLISPKYFNIITDGYIIDERIKYNIYINKGIFILDLSKNVIEIALIETPYSYKAIYLIKYEETCNYNEEIKKIFSNGFIEYLKQNDIPEDTLYEYDKIHKNKFSLIRLYLNEHKRINLMKNISEKIIPISSKGLEINNKKCFLIFNQESSKLNSIIQVLTSIKEIYTYFTKNEITSIIKKFDHIYVLSSFFFEVINDIYNKKISLEHMNIILNFLSPNITKKDLYDLLNFILQTLHNELIPFPQNLNQENLISYDSPFTDRNNSLAQFYNYYFPNNNNINNSYKKSLISELFNWIREKKVNCNNTYYTSSFQALPLIIFDMDLLFKKEISNKKLIFHLNNCFENYSKVENNDIDKPCIYCHQIHFSTHFIYTTPAYFIIVLDRKNTPPEVRIKYSNELDLSIYAENLNYKKYKLIGVIMQEGDDYYSIIKNEKDDSCSNIEEWKKFKNDKVDDIIIDISKSLNKDSKKINDEVYNEFNSRILFYKGVNS